MKKLKKLKLSNADIMNEQQMKKIVGGAIAGGEYGNCDTHGATCSGGCIATGGFTGTCGWVEFEADGIVIDKLCGCYA